MGVRFLEEWRDKRFPDLFYADNLVFCDESEEDLKVKVVCRSGLVGTRLEKRVSSNIWGGRLDMETV